MSARNKKANENYRSWFQGTWSAVLSCIFVLLLWNRNAIFGFVSSPSIVSGRLNTPKQFLLCIEGQRITAELYITYKQAYNTVTYDW